MFILLLIYLFIHQHHLPFRWRYVNKLESYLIACITAIIFINANTLNVDKIFYDIIISLLILFPIIWYLWFLFSNYKSLKNKGQKVHVIPNQDSQIEMDDGDEIELATTKYHTDAQQDQITLHMQLQNSQNHHVLASQ